MVKYTRKKKPAHPKRKVKVSPHKNAAQIRKCVRAETERLNALFPLGEFVNEKYVTASVGLIVDKVHATKKYKTLTMGEVDPGYAARHLYGYWIKVMWLHHPDTDKPQTELIPVSYVKIRNTKKKVL